MTTISVIAGPMFSGKSEELIRRLKRALHAGLKVLVIKPKTDTRFDPDEIAAREKNKNGEFVKRITYPAHPVSTRKEVLRLIKKERPDVLGIEEGQFFGNWVIGLIKEFRDNPVYGIQKILIAGLDMDYRKREFGPMPRLMAIADSVSKVKAVCFNCKRRPAGFTQRISGTREQIQVDDGASYEARCIKCHYVFKPKSDS